MGYKFVKTQDGSAGLFDDNVNDIYHSSSGAYKEALDKFVIPAQIERFKNSKCRVLDICYGIGYNTKALFNYSVENNYNIEFEIDALEMNEELIQLSPFIKMPNQNQINSDTDKFLLEAVLNNKIDFEKIKTIINKNKNFLTLYKPEFDKILQNWGYSYGVYEKINAILHNIYYQYNSKRHKIPQKSYNFTNSSIKLHINDARKSILTLSGKYDIIFHDGFTAVKQPILWTDEFLHKVCDLLNKTNGVIVSYSVASPFRNSLKNYGLNVGKYYLKNINSTLASYNKNIVKYELDRFEINLLNTKAGMPYNDSSLSLTSEQIIEHRHADIINSKLESTSSYYKRNGRKHGTF